MEAHKDDIKQSTWIVDEAETEESAAEVCHLDTTITWLCYERLEYKLGEVVATSHELVAKHGI